MALFVAIGVVGAQFIWFPAGIAKAYPVQHAVNVIAAIMLGPFAKVLMGTTFAVWFFLPPFLVSSVTELT